MHLRKVSAHVSLRGLLTQTETFGYVQIVCMSPDRSTSRTSRLFYEMEFL